MTGSIALLRMTECSQIRRPTLESNLKFYYLWRHA